MAALSAWILSVALGAGALGEGPYEEIALGAAKVQAFRAGLRVLAGKTEWVVLAKALPITREEASGYAGERVPVVAGTDARCGLVFVALNLDAGTNVSLAIYELRVASREVVRLGTLFGSGVTACSLGEGGLSLGCLVGSHSSAAVGRQDPATLKRDAAWCRPVGAR